MRKPKDLFANTPATSDNQSSSEGANSLARLNAQQSKEAHDALANDDWALVGTSDLEENNVKSPLLFNEVYKKSSTDEQRQAPLNKTSKNNIG
jgi:hypothetical protein